MRRLASKLAAMSTPKTPATSPLTQGIAQAVRGEMAKQGLTQEALGARIGWDQRRVSRRLTAEVSFTMAELSDVASALGVSVMQLIPIEVGA